MNRGKHLAADDLSFFPWSSENNFSEQGEIALAAALSMLTSLEDVNVRFVRIILCRGDQTNQSSLDSFAVFLLLTVYMHKADYFDFSAVLSNHSKGNHLTGAKKGFRDCQRR